MEEQQDMDLLSQIYKIRITKGERPQRHCAEDCVNQKWEKGNKGIVPFVHLFSTEATVNVIDRILEPSV